jgi:hypothetical protein
VALYWDGGPTVNSWSALIGEASDSTLTTFTISNGITTGELYKFRHRAKNIFGFGPYSDEVTIKAATKPDQMAAV